MPASENRGFLAMNPDMVFRRLDANGDGRVTSDELPADAAKTFRS